jgi:hypothetical protein
MLPNESVAIASIQKNLSGHASGTTNTSLQFSGVAIVNPNPNGSCHRPRARTHPFQEASPAMSPPTRSTRNSIHHVAVDDRFICTTACESRDSQRSSRSWLTCVVRRSNTAGTPKDGTWHLRIGTRESSSACCISQRPITVKDGHQTYRTHGPKAICDSPQSARFRLRQGYGGPPKRRAKAEASALRRIEKRRVRAQGERTLTAR